MSVDHIRAAVVEAHVVRLEQEALDQSPERLLREGHVAPHHRVAVGDHVLLEAQRAVQVPANQAPHTSAAPLGPLLGLDHPVAAELDLGLELRQYQRQLHAFGVVRVLIHVQTADHLRAGDGAGAGSKWR